jgi:hypothetical protein
LLALVLAVATFAASAHAQERVDTFTPKGQRQGAVVQEDRSNGQRWDLYDRRGNREGSIQMDRSGTRGDLYDTRGNRRGSVERTPGSSSSSGGRR